MLGPKTVNDCHFHVAPTVFFIHSHYFLPRKLLNKRGDVTALFPHPAICRGDQEEETFSHRRSAFESDRSYLKSLLCALQGVGTTLWKTGIMSPQRVVVSIRRRWAFTVNVRPLSPWVAKQQNGADDLLSILNTKSQLTFIDCFLCGGCRSLL